MTPADRLRLFAELADPRSRMAAQVRLAASFGCDALEAVRCGDADSSRTNAKLAASFALAASGFAAGLPHSQSHWMAL